MSVSRRIKYFQRIAIFLTICWSLMTTLFMVYQFYNEEKHIEASSLEKIKGVSEQSVAFIYWAYEQKSKALSEKEKFTIEKNFSLKELLNILTQKSGMNFQIQPTSQNHNANMVHPPIKEALKTLKKDKEDTFSIYVKDEQKHLVYFKPLVANSHCISCHVHDDSKVGDLLGFASVEMKMPSFKEANPQSYYFLGIMYFGTWLLGLFAIWWIHLKGKNYLNEKTKIYEESVYALVAMMEKRDRYTAGHSIRVAEYAKKLILALGYSFDDAEFIYKAGMLHDIGKIEIPDAILLKPDKLTASEYSLIKLHSHASYELLLREPFTEFAKIVLHHHEWYNGKGYPSGLKGDEIPFFSQIICIADSFDAMTTNRAYRLGLSREEALKILQEESGEQFNPLVIPVALNVFRTIKLPENTTQMPHDLLEEMRFSYYFRDQLTGYYNINYLKFLFTHNVDNKNRLLSVDHINCVNFALYNKKNGWKSGDEFLKLIAKTIEGIYPEAMIVRVYSDNFLVLHVKPHTPMQYAKIDTLLGENGLHAVYKHIDLSVQEELSFDILEDKLLRLEN